MKLILDIVGTRKLSLIFLSKDPLIGEILDQAEVQLKLMIYRLTTPQWTTEQTREKMRLDELKVLSLKTYIDNDEQIIGREHQNDRASEHMIADGSILYIHFPSSKVKARTQPKRRHCKNQTS